MFILLQFDEIFMRNLFYLRLYLTNLIAKMQENISYSREIEFHFHPIALLHCTSIQLDPNQHLIWGDSYFSSDIFCLNSKDQTEASALQESQAPPAGFTKFVTFRLIELYPDCSTDEKQQRNKLPQRQYYKVKTEQKMRAQVTRKTQKDLES